MKVSTDYPWDYEVNGEKVEAATKDGYALVSRKWKKGDEIRLSLDMPVRVVAADPRVKADEGLGEV